MRFFKFESKEQFESIVKTSDVEFSKDGLTFSVIGLSVDTIIEEQITYLDGWHVNAMGEIPAEWDDFEVFVNSPIRIFG